jgi:hypothetical protein
MFQATTYCVKRGTISSTIVSLYAYWYTKPTFTAVEEVFNEWRAILLYDKLTVRIEEVPDDV